MQRQMARLVKVPTNKILGVLWANDDDGRIFAKVMPPESCRETDSR